MAARSGRETYDDPVNDKFMVDIVARLSAAEKANADLLKTVRGLEKQVGELKRGA